MSELRAELEKVLDRDAPWGPLALVRAGPVEQAERLLGEDRLAEAIPIVAELARAHSSVRLRVNALTLWPKLLVAQPTPSIQEMYKMRQPYEPLQPFFDGALALASDPAAEVRAAAAALLLQYTSPADQPALRAKLAHLGPELAASHGRAAEQALAVLRGSRGALDVVEAALASGDLAWEKLLPALDQLEREPLPEAAPALAKLFARLPIVAERHVPIRLRVPGVAAVADPQTTLAVTTLKAWLGSVPPERAADALDFIREAGGELFALLVDALTGAGAAGATLAIAIAAAEPIVTPLRERAVHVLTAFLRTTGVTAALARNGLRGLAGDPEVGGAARAALERA